VIRREGTEGLELKVTEESEWELERDEDIEWSNDMNKRKETSFRNHAEIDRERKREGKKREKMKEIEGRETSS